MLNERADKLDKIVGNNLVTTNFPLYKELPIHANLFEKLVDDVSYYVTSSAYAANLPICLNKLDLSINLPNRTPNGLILPKKQNHLAYNCIHKTIKEIIESLNLQEHISLIHSPVNVRSINTKANPEIDNRPHSSTKLHSDVWAGEFTNTTMVFIPIYGDTKDGGVEFFEPSDRFLSFIKPLADYNEGADLIEDAVKYDCVLETGHLYLTDPFLLHKTIKRGSGVRISIDFRFISKYTVSSDVLVDSKRHENYISYNEWAQIGTNKLLLSNANIDEIEQSSQIEYAAKFTIINI
jgi:hypothetical protein